MVSVLAGLLVAPGFAVQALPQLRPEDVGRPFESASAAGFKATRDYDLPDAALTARRRQEARAGVRPVFDFSPGVVPEVQGAIRRGHGDHHLGNVAIVVFRLHPQGPQRAGGADAED